jgi:hypothetical protein
MENYLEIWQVVDHNDGYHWSTNDGSQPYDFALRTSNQISDWDFYPHYEGIAKNDPTPVWVYELVGLFVSKNSEVVKNGFSKGEDIIR